MIRFQAKGSGTAGVLTTKLLIDTNEESPAWRNTIPLPAGTEVISGLYLEPKTFSSTSIHSLQLQGYGTANWEISDTSSAYTIIVYMIKISD